MRNLIEIWYQKSHVCTQAHKGFSWRSIIYLWQCF